MCDSLGKKFLPDCVKPAFGYEVEEGEALIKDDNAAPGKIDLCQKVTRFVTTNVAAGMAVMGGYLYHASHHVADKATALAQEQFLSYVNGLPNVIPGDNSTKALNMSNLPTFSNNGGFSERSSEIGMGTMIATGILGAGLIYYAGKAMVGTVLDYRNGNRHYGYEQI